MLTVLRCWESMLDPNEIECRRGYHGSDQRHHYKYLSRLKIKMLVVELYISFLSFVLPPRLCCSS